MNTNHVCLSELQSKYNKFVWLCILLFLVRYRQIQWLTQTFIREGLIL